MTLAYLSPEAVDAIHEATLRILAETGIRLGGGEARTLLLDHGAAECNGRICLPPDLVENCLARCPGQVILAGRGGQVVLGDGSLHVHNLGGARDVLELPGGDPAATAGQRLRPALAQDVADSARLLDALPHVNTVTPMYTPQDAPPAAMAAVMLDRTLRNTLKPINGPGVQTAAEARLLAEMLRVVLPGRSRLRDCVGDRPAASLGVSPISPLHFPAELAGAILEVARQGLALGPLPCPNAGATAPMSLAGALAQQNAENLAAIVLAQLAAPGLPIIYCGRLAVLDMRTMTPAWGNPEIGLVSAATVQLGHRYGLPVNVYGLACNTYSLDLQNGYERALNAIVPALAGADELSGVGEMAGGVCSCPAQMVVDDEIMGMVQRLRRGFAVDADSLAVEVIAQAMAGPGNFLADEHTVRYLRSGELWRPRLAIQEASWQLWQEAGGPTVVQRAQERAGRLLASHEVPPLPDEEAAALNEIVAANSFAA